MTIDEEQLEILVDLVDMLRDYGRLPKTKLDPILERAKKLDDKIKAKRKRQPETMIPAP